MQFLPARPHKLAGWNMAYLEASSDRPLEPVHSIALVAGALGPLSRQILVETANRFQGLERKVVLAIHPLSGLLRPSEFELNPGRMCVSMSRHSVMCILLTRAGVEETLAGYMPDDDRFLGQPDDPSFTGWRAHEAVWRRLHAEERLLSA